MNAQPQAVSVPSKSRKVVFQFVLGALSGAAAMAAMLWALEQQEGLLEQPGRMAALATAMVYALMALVVGLGSMVPRIGAKALNVEDAEELEEQKPDLLLGTLSFLLVATLLGSLALSAGAGVDGLYTTSTAAVLAGLSAAGLLYLSIVNRKRGDEMMRAVSQEANGWVVAFVFVVFGSWSALAHLELAPPFQPLLFLAGFFALYLLAIFVAAGRRGLMKPR